MGVKFIQALDNGYVNVSKVITFGIEYKDGQFGIEYKDGKFYVTANTEDDVEYLSVHEEKYQAKMALPDLIEAINGG